MNTHLNLSSNSGTTHSNSQEQAETPPRLEEVDLEELAINFLCPYSTHPDWKQIVSSSNEYGQTIAHISVTLGYFRLLRYLFRWEIDLGIVDNMGSTALHYAYIFRQEECARLLIHAGANALLLDNLGRSPSDLDPSLEVKLHPTVGIDGDSITHSASSTGCDIKMPGEAEGLYAKRFFVRQWRRRIEDERGDEILPSRFQGQDTWGPSEAASTPPIDDSTNDDFGGVTHSQSFSSSVQFSQGVPTLVASQDMEARTETAVPTGTLSPYVGASAQATVGGPDHTESQGYKALLGSKIIPYLRGRISDSSASIMFLHYVALSLRAEEPISGCVRF